MGRLPLEHIVGQIREDVLLAAIEAAKQMPRRRLGRLFHFRRPPGVQRGARVRRAGSGRPALHICADRLKLVGRERQIAGRKECLDFVGREAQVGGAQLDQLLARPQTRERERRVGAAADRQAVADLAGDPAERPQQREPPAR